MGKKEDIKTSILFHLYRRKLWGSSYTPKEKAMSKLPKRLRGKGTDTIENLVKRGLTLEHKRGNCISLNTKKKEEIMKILKQNYPDYYF